MSGVLQQTRRAGCVWILLAGLLAGCNLGKGEPEIIYITETPPLEAIAESTQQPPPPTVVLSPVPEVVAAQPTLDPPRGGANASRPQQYVVKAGDTLYDIALVYGITLDALLEANQLENPNALYVGQAIQLPEMPTQRTPEFKIIPDSRLVRGPGSRSFDIERFVSQLPGYIRQAADTVMTRQADGSTLEETLTAAQIVERVALDYSVDPRLLLALLEYRAQWLSNPYLPAMLKTHPMISEADSGDIDRAGLYYQLTWAANQLNWGYYSWKYRGWATLEFSEGTRLIYAPGLNAGTVALQYFLALFSTYDAWQQDISVSGLYRTYYAYFGDPFKGAVEPLVPPNIDQPPLALPFSPGQTWFFTGSAHGGWNTGSAWSAVDFAPPDEPKAGMACYISDYPVTAVAPGVIARSKNGAVVLDLDGDGDEATGWTIFYLHLASENRVQAGTPVQTGDPLGYASCEGGFSTATHLHIARRYNGEWIPATCHDCASQDQRPPFDMGGWMVVGYEGQEYQGYLFKDGSQVLAEQGRLNPDNRIAW